MKRPLEIFQDSEVRRIKIRRASRAANLALGELLSMGELHEAETICKGVLAICAKKVVFA